MSKTFFTENAYNVLGLDSSASEKEILKRSREIENLLKIDEIPEYELDLPFSKEVRTEIKVKKAAERLTTPDKKIIETFFWFFIKDNTDEKALKLFKDGDYVGALETLQSKVTASPNNFTAVRNKAVLESLIFTEKAQNKYLEASLKSWQTILTSDKQWTDFQKVYKLNNPDASDALFDNFKKNAEKNLSSFYESMSKAEDKPEIYAAFSKRFSAHSDSFERDTLDPLLNKLDELTKRIQKYNIDFDSFSYAEHDKYISTESEDIIKKFKKESDKITDEIQALGDIIWNSSKVKVVRDENAMALRRLAIEISNNSNLVKCPNDKKLLDELLTVAYNICSDGSVAERKIEEDQDGSKELDKTLRKIRKNNENVEEVKKKMDRAAALIRSHNFDGALKIIDECLEYELGAEDVAFLRDLREKCVQAANKKDSDTVWGIIGIIVLIILAIIWAVNTFGGSTTKSSTSTKSASEVQSICRSSGINSSACKNAQSNNNVTCNNYSGTITCKKK